MISTIYNKKSFVIKNEEIKQWFFRQKCSKWCPFALMQHCSRPISEAHTLLNTCGTDCHTCCNNSLLHIFRCDRMSHVLHKKKLNGVMSGERAGHEIGPPHPIHLGRFYWV